MKLVISLVVWDDDIMVDDLEEILMEKFGDDIQSIDVAAMSKGRCLRTYMCMPALTCRPRCSVTVWGARHSRHGKSGCAKERTMGDLIYNNNASASIGCLPLALYI
jgi:hypothetical protein